MKLQSRRILFSLALALAWSGVAPGGVAAQSAPGRAASPPQLIGRLWPVFWNVELRTHNRAPMLNGQWHVRRLTSTDRADYRRSLTLARQLLNSPLR